MSSTLIQYMMNYYGLPVTEFVRLTDGNVYRYDFVNDDYSNDPEWIITGSLTEMELRALKAA